MPSFYFCGQFTVITLRFTVKEICCDFQPCQGSLNRRVKVFEIFLNYLGFFFLLLVTIYVAWLLFSSLMIWQVFYTFLQYIEWICNYFCCVLLLTYLPQRNFFSTCRGSNQCDSLHCERAGLLRWGGNLLHNQASSIQPPLQPSHCRKRLRFQRWHHHHDKWCYRGPCYCYNPTGKDVLLSNTCLYLEKKQDIV